MSKKVYVLSDYSYNNFGNKLQNFALLLTLRQNGYKVNNIILDLKHKNLFICVFRFLKPIFSIFLKQYRLTKKEKKIKCYSKKYEKKIFHYSYSTLSKIKLNRCHTVVFGSDQIWNPIYHEDLFFTTGNFQIKKERFAKISYAASFGVEDLDKTDIKIFLDNLATFKALSCREYTGVKILNKIGYKSELTCDPTLLLSKNDWIVNIKSRSKIKIPSNIHVLYFISKNYKLKNKIIDHLICNNFAYTDIMSPNDRYYAITQFDFLKFILFSQIVYTDSFHACLFSILFEKEFVVFERDDNVDPMNLRISNLLNLFGVKLIFGKLYTPDMFRNKEKFEQFVVSSKLFLFSNMK